ncbi:MAG TPA: MFS transporter [Armatimonadota bacterium]|jgi:MFS family permease
MEALPSDSQRSAPPERPRMTTWQQASLSLYWFATSAHWTAILITLLPLQAERIGGGAHKGTTLGAIMLVGALVSMVVAPLFGAWSDRIRTPWGRRRPFLVAGTIGNVLGLLMLAALPAVPSALIPYVLVFMWIELFNNLATAPYSAFIPDVVPAEQRGSASGWMGLMTMLGNFLGGIMGLLLAFLGGIPGAYIALAVIMVLGMLGTVLTVREPDPVATPPPFRLEEYFSGLAAPFRSRDFLWVFLTRFLVMLGIFTVQEFLQYYMKDVVGGGADVHRFFFFGTQLADTAHGATSFFVMALLLGAVISSLVAGALSDRYGRKRMVYLSGALQGVVAIIFMLTGRFEVVVLLGIIFGLGYGAYQAVDWALATDVLPSKEDHAKDMGVWHIALTLPQVLAVPIAGLLLDHFQKIGQQHGLPTLGYRVIFLLAFLYFVVGTVLVSRVKGVR